jgi:VWFA-related protein
MKRPAILLLFALAAGLLPAAGDEVVFRGGVSLVRVDAQVVDGNNRAITGLQAGDFVLLEQGRPQPIHNFGSENMPVDVLLLLDVSVSMRPHIQRIASAAHEAFRVLRPEDRVGIMVFDRSTRLRLPFRGSQQDVESEFQSLLRQEDFRGGTDITLGLLDAAGYVAREARPGARHAIIIVTDDQTEFDRDEDAVSHALVRADAVLSALIAPDAMRNRWGHGGGGQTSGGIGGPLGGIIFGRGRGSGSDRRSAPHTQSAGTSEIARSSGGDSMPLDDASSLENTLARIRQRYTLHFHLPEGVRPGQERNVKVELTDAACRRYPGAEVRYRRVYVTPAGTGAGAEPATVISAQGSEGSTLERRPAVNGPVTEGPTIGTTAPEPEDAQPAEAAPPAQAQPAQPAPPQQGGWRRVSP